MTARLQSSGMANIRTACAGRLSSVRTPLPPASSHWFVQPWCTKATTAYSAQNVRLAPGARSDIHVMTARHRHHTGGSMAIALPPKLPPTTPAKPKDCHNNNTIEPLCGSDGLLGIAVKSGTNCHCYLFATTERAVWELKTGRNGIPNGPYGNAKQHKSPTVWLPIDYAKPQQQSTRQANRLGSIVLATKGKPWKQLSRNNT